MRVYSHPDFDFGLFLHDSWAGLFLTIYGQRVQIEAIANASGAFEATVLVPGSTTDFPARKPIKVPCGMFAIVAEDASATVGYTLSRDALGVKPDAFSPPVPEFLTGSLDLARLPF